MSKKNTFEQKSARRSQRAARPAPDRTPVSPIAQKTSARLLSNPKQKMTGSTRRRLQRSRGFVLDVGSSVKRSTEVKVALRLEKLPLAKLYRRLKQTCRRAATCRNLLAALSRDSKFAPPIQAEQTHQLCLVKQIRAEISVRNHKTN